MLEEVDLRWLFEVKEELVEVAEVEEEEEVSAEYDKGILRQDRYPLRTSPQFAGPQIEALMLAHSQISTELNTTTDNPLIGEGKFHHGGNVSISESSNVHVPDASS